MNYLGINKKELTPVIKELNNLLCSYHVYYQNLRNFHWNVQGENFFKLHEKFEDLYNDAKLKVDEIAERILTLRFRPLSNMSDYLSKSKVKEAGTVEQDSKMVEVTLDNQAQLIEQMRAVLNEAEKVEDEGTIDLMGAYIRELEKQSWMLDAWLQRKIEPSYA